jgi:hypothetical protein
MRWNARAGRQHADEVQRIGRAHANDLARALGAAHAA